MSTMDVHLADSALVEELRKDVRDGLTADSKWLSPKYFYDAVGSELFEQITDCLSTTPPAPSARCSRRMPSTSPRQPNPRC